MSGQTIIPPGLDDVLVELKTEIFSTMNCIQIGKIEKVNSNQTVEISLQVKRRVSGDKTADYPLLVDCPYFVLQGGGAYLDMPIVKGDYALVLFNDRNIDTWWSTGNVKEPFDRRKHNLSDGIALIGLNSSINSLLSDGKIVRLLGPSGPGTEEFAARSGDPTIIDGSTDTALIAWIANVSTVLNSLVPGSVPSVPTTATGKISSGSGEVKIG